MNNNEFVEKVMWGKETEPPFSGKYVHTKDAGMYVCKNCGNELFSSTAKFDSETGWPSFDKAEAESDYPIGNSYGVVLKSDDSHGMRRTEVTCKKCEAHLGHLFDDGPTVTGKRYCINSVCLDLKG